MFYSVTQVAENSQSLAHFSQHCNKNRFFVCCSNGSTVDYMLSSDFYSFFWNWRQLPIDKRNVLYYNKHSQPRTLSFDIDNAEPSPFRRGERQYPPLFTQLDNRLASSARAKGSRGLSRGNKVHFSSGQWSRESPRHNDLNKDIGDFGIGDTLSVNKGRYTNYFRSRHDREFAIKRSRARDVDRAQFEKKRS